MEKKKLSMTTSGLSKPISKTTQEMALGTRQGNGIAKSRTTTNVNPASTTQRFYHAPSNQTNYDQNKPTYQANDAVQAAGQAVADAEAQKPDEYKGRFDNQIQGMIETILNRPDFHYDAAANPLYQQYAQQYQRNGQLAMRDAMAAAAGMTGGYGNSYAQQVGQQAYQRHLEEFGAMMPQLQQAAYDMYRDQGDTLRANLGMLQGADATDYGRYREQVGDWRDELNYLYGKYSDMSQDEYNRYLNDRDSWENDRNYWYQREQDQADRDWQREQDQADRGWQQMLFDYQREQDLADRDWQQMLFDYQREQDALAAQAAANASRRSSGSSRKKPTRDQIAEAASQMLTGAQAGIAGATSALANAAAAAASQQAANQNDWKPAAGPSINRRNNLKTRD